MSSGSAARTVDFELVSFYAICLHSQTNSKLALKFIIPTVIKFYHRSKHKSKKCLAKIEFLKRKLFTELHIEASFV